MRFIRSFTLLCVLMLVATIAFAQPKTPPKKPAPKPKTATFTGTLKQKPWTKSTQSYCAQGSEYFVLVQKGGEEIVLQNETDQDLTSFEGKAVTIEGKKETKTIKPSSNPMEQRPVNTNPFGDNTKEESFTCTVLIVKKIK